MEQPILRGKLIHHEAVDGFRWRSHEITRVEGLGLGAWMLVLWRERKRVTTEMRVRASHRGEDDAVDDHPAEE